MALALADPAMKKFDLGTDWRSGKGYPPTSAPYRQWAWEFLRRSVEYQLAWCEYAALVGEVVPGFDGDFASLNAIDPDRARAFAEAIEDDERLQDYSPPRLQSESEIEWLKRVGTGRTRPLVAVLGERFGLDHIVCPAWGYSGLNVRFSGAPGGVRKFVSGDMRKRGSGKCEDAFIIDYRYPIAPQIEQIKRFAEAKQARLIDAQVVSKQPERRARKDDWRHYLRVLDGLADDATSAEIGAVIFPTDDNSAPTYGRNKRAHNAVKAATELCEVGYRFIPWLKK